MGRGGYGEGGREGCRLEKGHWREGTGGGDERRDVLAVEIGALIRIFWHKFTRVQFLVTVFSDVAGNLSQ